MKEMTATEVARSFSAVLDAVESGETVVVTRGGERLATIAPAPRANGAAINEIVRKHMVDPSLVQDDDEFVRAVRWARTAGNGLDGDPWLD